MAAALGAAADAIAVSDHGSAVSALRRLRAEDSSRATLLVAGSSSTTDEPWPTLPYGVRYAIDVVSAPDDLRAPLAGVLARIAVVDDLDQARALVASHPGVSAATRDGDLVGPLTASGGSCLLYTSPRPRDRTRSRMPSSA